MADPDGTRIGDAERQQVIDTLRQATGEGRLTLDEFAERAGEVFAARTRGELDQVIDDLPPGVRERTPGPAATTSPSPGADSPRPDARPAAPSGGRRTFIAIMGGSRPRGRWRAAGKITAFAFWGGVTVDLRNALIETPTLEITAWAIMGGVNVVVPEGIPVELDGLVIMGGSHDATRPGRIIDGAPVVRIRARGLWGGVTAWTRRERSSRHGSGHGHHRRDRHRDRDRRDEANLDDHWSLGHGVPMPPTPRPPQVPPMPSLPGPSLGDMIPPLPGGPGTQAHRRSRAGSRHGEAGGEATERPAPVRADGAAATEAPSAADAPANAGAPANADAPAPDIPANAGPQADVGGRTARSDSFAGPAVAARPNSGTLTVLVTDICRSTEIAAALGDQRWLGVLLAHNALVREQIHRHHGVEVKAQGDGFLVTFTSARQAVLAAMAIQRALESYRRSHPEHQIELRAGIHTGEVVEDQGDVLGQNVVVAVRIADAARPGEVLVSSLTKDLTDAGGDLRYDEGRVVELKGVARPWRVHAVAWS